MFYQRVAIFIDAANLFHALRRSFNRIDLDFDCLVKKLCAGRPLFRVYYYSVLPDPERHPNRYRKQQNFLEALRDKDYFTVRLGRLIPHGGTYIEKGVDIAIAVDMIRFAFRNAYDTAILISGDSDLVRAVELVQDFGKHVENAVIPSAQSRHLRQTCDRFIELNESYLRDCWRNENQ